MYVSLNVFVKIIIKHRSQRQVLLGVGIWDSGKRLAFRSLNHDFRSFTSWGNVLEVLIIGEVDLLFGFFRGTYPLGFLHLIIT